LRCETNSCILPETTTVSPDIKGNDMASDTFTSAIIQATSRTLSVSELIRTAETLRQNGEVSSVENLYAVWIQCNHDDPLLYAVLFNYAVTLSDVGKLQDAKGCLERALLLQPDFMPAHINLGRLLERLGHVGLAVAQWTAALAKTAAVNGVAVGHKTTALNQSARALEAANQDVAAEDLLHQSLELDSHQREVIQHLIALRQRQCEWPIVVPSERVARNALMEGMSPLSAAAYTDDPMFQLALAWFYNKSDVGTPTGVMMDWPQARKNTGRLRVGYLSSDLREHAVGFLLAEVLGLHDRNQVEVFAYYCGPESQDPLHANFKASADHWRSIATMDDPTAARQMAEDGIQILVDLNGYTREARLKLVALRPAPIIVNWLGFPGTMASPYHHYLIADDWVVPETHDIYYSEEVLRLPCYQPNNRKRLVSPRQLLRSEVGLPDNAMVYCCFNGTHKLNRSTFDRWLTIMKGVPNSVLWLLSSSEGTHARLHEYANQQGISRERLVFAEKMANPAHLARYPLADLFLDTTPYGAHTTASDALWMGIPVLTLSGRSFASRVCGSLVRSAGVPELICSSAEEYVRRAIAFGKEPGSLAPYREKLRASRDTCALFNTPALVNHLEQLYQQMWQQFEKRSLPRPDLTNLDAYLEVGNQVDHEETDVQSMVDYQGWWIDRLAMRHSVRPIAPDHRFARGAAFSNSGHQPCNGALGICPNE
jgi:predicted O-linked N-acetylglucosamine transferase (SPINDLY family)